MHRLRRLDAGVDGDQGLSRSTPMSALQSPPGPPGGPAPHATDAVAGSRLPGGPGGAPHHLPVDAERLHRRDRADLDARELRATCSPSRSTGRSRCARSAIAALVTVIDAVLAFPIALFMAKVASPRLAAAAGHRGADAAVGVVPGQGLRVAWACSSADGPARRRSRRRSGWARPATAWSRTTITLAYLWLPVHDPADLRGPRAGAELVVRGLRRPRRRFAARRSVGWCIPVAFPAIVAGSIFTFSLLHGRLHRGQDRRRYQPAARQRRLRQLRAPPTTCRSPLRWPRSRSSSCSSTSRRPVAPARWTSVS